MSSHDFQGRHDPHTGNTAVTLALADIEERIHIEKLPGTEVMASDSAVENVKIDRGAKDGTVLVPQPSDDPHDPLNWTLFWKLAVIINQTCFVYISILTPLSIAPLTPIFVKKFDKSLSEIALFTGAAVIALGYANLLIIPYSNIFGRRSATLICSIICIVSNVWQATANSYTSFLGARVVSGLGAAANESIMVTVIADVFFLHQRGRWMGLYFWAYFMGSFSGPIISGNIAAHISYKWFFWICTIAQGVSTTSLSSSTNPSTGLIKKLIAFQANFLTMFFFFPETKYRRPAKLQVSAPVAKDQSNEKPTPALSRLLSSPSVDAYNIPSKVEITKDEVLNEQSERDLASSDSDPESFPIDFQRLAGQGGPSSSQRWALFPKPDPIAVKSVFRDLITPIKIAFYPIILWASLAFGFAANTSLDLNITQSQVFASPPYNFSPSRVGLVNLALVTGAAIGLLTAGPLSDWISMRSTKKNDGVREPEMRLPAMIPYIAACVVGSTIVAVGYERTWPWEVIVIVGFGLVGLMVVAIPTIGLTYAIDSYKPIAGEIMVIGTICKNTFGFGMTYFINDWAIRSGYIGPIMLLGGLTFGISFIGVVGFWIRGKGFRRWTRNSWVHNL